MATVVKSKPSARNEAPELVKGLRLYDASTITWMAGKGAVVGLQWALRMHGFDDNPPDGIPPV